MSSRTYHRPALCQSGRMDVRTRREQKKGRPEGRPRGCELTQALTTASTVCGSAWLYERFIVTLSVHPPAACTSTSGRCFRAVRQPRLNECHAPCGRWATFAARSALRHVRLANSRALGGKSGVSPTPGTSFCQHRRVSAARPFIATRCGWRFFVTGESVYQEREPCGAWSLLSNVTSFQRSSRIALSRCPVSHASVSRTPNSGGKRDATAAIFS